MAMCIVCGMSTDPSKSPALDYEGAVYYFASGMHRLIFSLYPDLFLNRADNSFGSRLGRDSDSQAE